MKYKLYLLGLLSLMTACKHHEIQPESVLPAPAVQTELDTWLEEHISRPYQAEVIYRWDKNNASQASFIYPPQTAKVRPVMEALEATVLKMYKDKDFFPSKDFMPNAPLLRIYLYGGGNIDQQGVDLPFDRVSPATELKIYNVDKFNPQDPDEVYRLVRSAQHQIAKHLMDIHPYDHNKFIKISQNKYISSTEDIADAFKSYTNSRESLKEAIGLNRYAWSRGFYSILGLLSPKEDLAEMYSVTLTSTPSEINHAEQDAAVPDEATGDSHAERLYAERAKEAHQAFVLKRKFISDYIKAEWGISLQRLQLYSLTLINQYNKNHESSES